MVVHRRDETQRPRTRRAFTDGIELTIADTDQAEALREPLRTLERRINDKVETMHSSGTVLDRSVSAHRSDEPFDYGDHVDLPLKDAKGSWGAQVAYGQDGEPHYVTQHDFTRKYPLIHLTITSDGVVMNTTLATLALMEPPILAPLGVAWLGPEPDDDSDFAQNFPPHWMTGRVNDPANDELRDVWSNRSLANPIVIDDEWARSFNETWHAVRTIVEGDWPAIHAAFNRRLELRPVPMASSLRHLGLMIVIEALLTHAPIDGDPADSIGRQIQTKLPLLSHRMTRPLPFADLEPDATTSTLISRLYEYRSAIAHGAEPEFKGKLRVLGSRERVGAFLETATRRLLRQAVLEPQLVTDLKGPARGDR